MRARTAGLILLMLLLTAAAARAEYTFAVSYSAGGREETVYSRANGDHYKICLPGYFDMGSLTVRFAEEGKTLYFGDTEIRSGETADFSAFAGRTVPVRSSKKSNIGEVSFYQGSEIPCVFIQVDEKQLNGVLKDKESVIEEGGIRVRMPDGSTVYDGELIQMKGRGNNTYSSKYAKKPFQIKLAKKADFFGMGKGRTWLLISGHQDLSLLRNQIMLDLWRETAGDSAVGCTQVDLFLNGIYNGLYLLTEKIQIGKNRLDIHNLEEETEEINGGTVDSFPFFSEKKKKGEVRGYRIPRDPEDITGGYLIEIEKSYRYRNERSGGFKTDNDLCCVIKEPTFPSTAQAEYIRAAVSAAHAAIASPDGRDPATGGYYTDLIDVESFALKYLAEDFCKNYDALAGSQFLYKDRDAADPLIHAGPGWDYDLCFGNININGIGRGYLPEDSYVTAIHNGQVNWYAQLYAHEDFREAVRRVYREKFRPALSVLTGETEGGKTIRSLEEYREAVLASSEMNFNRWNAGSITGYYPPSGSSNPAAVDYLFRWIRKRAEDMDRVYRDGEAP